MTMMMTTMSSGNAGAEDYTRTQSIYTYRERERDRWRENKRVNPPHRRHQHHRRWWYYRRRRIPMVAKDDGDDDDDGCWQGGAGGMMRGFMRGSVIPPLPFIYCRLHQRQLRPVAAVD